MNLQGKHILLGISGGIAAYKIPFLIRLLRAEGAEVRVCCSPHALEFVTELTLRTLSGYPVYSDVFAAVNAHATEHISLPDWADLMLVAPATADILCKCASGVADCALTTTYSAFRTRGPVLFAPAMNTAMYDNPATQDAIARLACANTKVLPTDDGPLACGTSGPGRMLQPEALLEAIFSALTPKTLAGRHILITAGPTIERLDPVRYISNFSTGKMGLALAAECRRRGADVTLVMGQLSAAQMLDRCVAAWPSCDTAILCAAVADYRPAEYSDTKIKKVPGASDHLSLPLVLNPDIAATLGASKRPDQRLIGFALETNNGPENALLKLRAKHLDAIVLNTPSATTGFGTDTNAVTIIAANGHEKKLPLASKQEIASGILDFCC